MQLACEKRLNIGDYREKTNALMSLLELHDKATYLHSVNVFNVSKELSEELGLDKQEQEIVKYGGLLHDIGKISIERNILTKPQKLNEKEYEKIQTHAENGRKILEEFSYPIEIVESAAFHHERYDGKGYPNHIRGEDIPIIARIISVADVYSAIREKRAYKEEKDNDYALNIIKELKGTQLDPKIVDALIQIKKGKKTYA